MSSYMSSVFQAVVVVVNSFWAASSYLLYSGERAILENMENAVQLDFNNLHSSFETRSNNRIAYATLTGIITGNGPGLARTRPDSLLWIKERALNVIRDVKKFGTVIFVNSSGEPIMAPVFPFRQSNFTFGISSFNYRPFGLIADSSNTTPFVNVATSSWSDKFHRSEAPNFLKLTFPSFGSLLSSVEGILQGGSIDIGARVTIFGQFELTKAGGIHLLATGDINAPNIFTKLTVEEIIAKQRLNVKVYRILMILFFTSWLCMLGNMILVDFRLYKQDQNRLNLFKQMLKHTHKGCAPNSANQSLDDARKLHRTCVTCNNNERDIIFLSCGHVCVCEECSQKLHGQCPVCYRISKTVRSAYLC